MTSNLSCLELTNRFRRRCSTVGVRVQKQTGRYVRVQFFPVSLAPTPFHCLGYSHSLATPFLRFLFSSRPLPFLISDAIKKWHPVFGCVVSRPVRLCFTKRCLVPASFVAPFEQTLADRAPSY